jgi:hypothetical protein
VKQAGPARGRPKTRTLQELDHFRYLILHFFRLLADCGPETRPQADRHLGNDGLEQVLDVLRQRPHLHHPRTDLPGRDPLQQEPGGGLRGRRRQAGAADPPPTPVRRHSHLHAGPGGHRGDLRGIASLWASL